MDFSEDARTVAAASRQIEQPPLVARVSDLDTAVDGLESRVLNLIKKIEPILHPEYDEKDPGRGTPDRPEQSEMAHVINNLSDRISYLSERVWRVSSRVEL